MKVTTFSGLALVISSVAAAPLSQPHTTYEARWWKGHAKHQLPGGKKVKEPSYFTSAFSTRAVDTTIINGTQSVPGQAGAFGHFSFKINTDKDIVCWDIRTVNVTGDYQSPAVTATHIHQAAAGASGPPRLAFPNPEYVRNDITGAEVRQTKGCMKGPFTTGVNLPNSETDSGTESGFTLSDIQENPSDFFADTHTQQFTAGAIRGQLLPSEREVKRPDYFTSVLKTEATADQVIGATGAPTSGLEGAAGHYTLEINSDKDVVCYDIQLSNVDEKEEYFSPAKTATHTHNAAFGLNGPPRLAYKNPRPKSKGKMWKWWKHGSKKSSSRHSSACIKGPFTTGLLANGIDTGSASGFTLKQLEANPSSYFSDFHTESKQAGAVRGQMYSS